MILVVAVGIIIIVIIIVIVIIVHLVHVVVVVILGRTVVTELWFQLVGVTLGDDETLGMFD